jgi:hypothetical protein
MLYVFLSTVGKKGQYCHQHYMHLQHKSSSSVNNYEHYTYNAATVVALHENAEPDWGPFLTKCNQCINVRVKNIYQTQTACDGWDDKIGIPIPTSLNRMFAMVMKSPVCHQKLLPIANPKLPSMMTHHLHLASNTLCLKLHDSHHHCRQTPLREIIPCARSVHGVSPYTSWWATIT